MGARNVILCEASKQITIAGWYRVARGRSGSRCRLGLNVPPLLILIPTQDEDRPGRAAGTRNKQRASLAMLC